VKSVVTASPSVVDASKSALAMSLAPRPSGSGALAGEPSSMKVTGMEARFSASFCQLGVQSSAEQVKTPKNGRISAAGVGWFNAAIKAAASVSAVSETK
jgi:hypothetical protein